MSLAPQRFAWQVAILRDKYREIGHLRGAWNREIDLIRAKGCREFPEGAVKRAKKRVFAWQKAFPRALRAVVGRAGTRDEKNRD